MEKPKICMRGSVETYLARLDWTLFVFFSNFVFLENSILFHVKEWSQVYNKIAL